MRDDLKDLLEGADAPTMHVDPGAVVAGGRRRQRRRTAAATGMLTAVVAALAFGAAAVRGAGHEAVPPASSSSTTASPSTPPTTAAPSQEPVSARVTLRIGHCVVEYVDFDGQRWGLRKEHQFGGGGGAVPAKWPSGTGIMQRLSADRARYTDDAGTVLDFLPVDDPAVLRIEGKLCA